jgi:HD-like signal output (HDOD) protein
MTQRDDIVSALARVVSGGDFTVPPYPSVALRLQRLLASDRHSLAEVADVVATDAVLAATVLAVANSATSGTSSPITSLNRAVGRLGARGVSAIAVAMSVSSVAVSRGALLDVKFRVWRRTMTCALVCQALAPARGVDSEEAFLAGLLHGFGRSIAVASIEQLLQDNAPSLALAAEEWLEIAEQQRAPLARAVAQSWQLPGPIAEAIDDRPRGVSTLNDLVNDANEVAGELLAGRRPSPPTSRDAPFLEALLAKLPGALDAFCSASGAASRLVTSASGAVVKPDHALTGELRRAALAVADLHDKGRSVLTCLSLGAVGIEIHSTRRYQECAVVRLTVGDAEQAFEPWFTVVLCVAEATGFRVELQLFSPTTAVRESWLALYEAAESIGASTHQRASLPVESASSLRAVAKS